MNVKDYLKFIFVILIPIILIVTVPMGIIMLIFAELTKNRIIVQISGIISLLIFLYPMGKYFTWALDKFKLSNKY